MSEQSLKDKTAKGLFWGGLSNGFQQLIGLVVGVILMRILNVEDYGLIGLLAIFSGIVSVIQETGFGAALINRKEFDPEDYNAVFWFNIFTSAFFYLVLFFCAPLIAEFYHKPELVPLSRVLFLTFLMSSMGIAQNAYLTKFMLIKQRSMADIIAISASGIMAILLSINGFGYWALAIQSLVFAFMWTFMRWFFSPWRPSFLITFVPLRYMIGFSSKLLFSSIITQIQANIFSFLLGRFSSVSNVGYYTQGVKWSGMGAMFIHGMINGVAQSVFVYSDADKEKLLQVFRKMLRFAAFISFPSLLGFAFISEDMLILINAEWLPSVPILQLYCLMAAFSPIHLLYGQLIISQNKSDFYFWSNLLYSFVQIAAAIISLRFGLYWMAFVSTALSLVYILVWHVFAKRLIPIKLKYVLKDISPYLFIVIISCLIVYILLLNVEIIILRLLLKIILVAILYILILWKTKSVMFNESVNFLLKINTKDGKH